MPPPEGGYKMFKIGDVFEIRPTKSYKMTNNDLFKHLGSIPLVSNTSVNNGITNNLSLAPTEDGNIITFSDTTTADSIFYQPNKFIGYSHVQGLYPRNPEGWDQDSLLYVVSLFRKQAKGRFSYAIKFNRKIASDMPLALPVTRTGEIDFAYMSERMQELKAERMQELKAYLSVAGFDD